MLVHLDGDCITSCELTVSLCISWVHVALQRGAGVILNWTVGRDLPDTSAAQILSILSEVLLCGMCVGGGGKASNDSENLHSEE